MFKYALSIMLLLVPLVIFADEFVAGKDYERIADTTIATATASPKVIVTEFFSYGCPWCYRIEPQLLQWLQQHNAAIEFSRVPVIFNKSWTLYAKAYYAAHFLGLDETLNAALFKAIQSDENSLTTNAEMIDFFTNAGVDKAIATSAFENSTTIDLRVQDGIETMARYHINAVPAIIVNNQYKIDLQMAKNPERFFTILDYLVKLSHQGA